MINSVRLKLASLAIAVLGLAAPLARAEWGNLNMPVGVTELSREIYDLHMIIFWWCVAIGVVVFGVMIYSLVKFRKSQGAVADTSMVHSTRAEIIWTVIPVFILVLMAIPATRTLIKIEDTRNTDLTIKVTGYQWKWQYEYIDDGYGFGFFSTLDRKSDAARQLQSGVDPTTIENYLLDVDNPLVVPEDTKVRLLVTAQDVLHAWWVPAFGLKKDAIPGYINEMWFNVEPGKTGTYRGQCVELCGRDHGFMPIVVNVVTKDQFKQWVADQRAKAAPPAAPADGEPPAEGGESAEAPAAETPAQARTPGPARDAAMGQSLGQG
jgi:cytochrome c oxidase subunit II